MEKKKYYIELLTAKGNNPVPTKEIDATFAEMVYFVNGALLGMSTRLKYCRAEVYDENGELIFLKCKKNYL